MALERHNGRPYRQRCCDRNMTGSSTLPSVPLIEIKRTADRRIAMSSQQFMDNVMLCCLQGVNRNNSKVLSVLFGKFCASQRRRETQHSLYRYLKQEWFTSSTWNDPFFQTTIKEIRDFCENHCSNVYESRLIERDIQEIFNFLYPSVEQEIHLNIADKVGYIYILTFCDIF